MADAKTEKQKVQEITEKLEQVSRSFLKARNTRHIWIPCLNSTITALTTPC